MHFSSKSANPDKKVYAPRWNVRNAKEIMRFFRITPDDKIEEFEKQCGIPLPPETQNRTSRKPQKQIIFIFFVSKKKMPQNVDAAPEVVFVPGIAFDAAGRRLGRGGGCYDRFARHVLQETPSAAKRPLFVGVSHGSRFVRRLPPVAVEPHDAPVDWLLLLLSPTKQREGACSRTNSRLFRCSRK